MNNQIRPFHILLTVAAALLALGIYTGGTFLMSSGLALAALGLLDIKRITRGPGSWAIDNALTLSAGAFFGAAFAILLT